MDRRKIEKGRTKNMKTAKCKTKVMNKRKAKTVKKMVKMNKKKVQNHKYLSKKVK
jgi:hypothetical protein